MSSFPEQRSPEGDDQITAVQVEELVAEHGIDTARLILEELAHKRENTGLILARNVLGSLRSNLEESGPLPPGAQPVSENPLPSALVLPGMPLTGKRTPRLQAVLFPSKYSQDFIKELGIEFPETSLCDEGISHRVSTLQSDDGEQVQRTFVWSSAEIVISASDLSPDEVSATDISEVFASKGCGLRTYPLFSTDTATGGFQHYAPPGQTVNRTSAEPVQIPVYKSVPPPSWAVKQRGS